MSSCAGLPFVKGHGTENDFVVIPDPTGVLSLTPALVARICDRRAGIGADGLLRVVPTALSPEVASLAGQTGWFMDYRNADGTLAEMCGNGVRVYARYLLEAGLISPGRLLLATRHGVREVLVGSGEDLITVDMGRARSGGTPVTITIAGKAYRAVPVDMGNPHAVVLLPQPVADLDLSVPPSVPAAAFPHGVNVEVVNLLGPGRLRMRVSERGVGETRSCGTGACAAALVAGPGREWTVEVPGGRLSVCWAGDRALLRGPAVLVAEGTIGPEWLRAADPGRGAAEIIG